MKKTAVAHRELYNAVRNSDSAKVVELVENHFNPPEE
jgi:DNA-binding GntR family transcriptional regulator